MEKRVDHAGEPGEDAELLLSGPSQEQEAIPPQKRKNLTRKKVVLLGSVFLLLALSGILGVSYLHTLPGNQKWFFHMGGTVTSSPTVVNGTVYVNADPLRLDLDDSRQGILIALDATTGHQKWFLGTDGTGSSAPVVVNGTVYVSTDHSSMGFDQGVLVAVNATSGHEEWSYPISEGNDAFSPLIANGLAYVVSQHGSLDALDALSGSKRWSFTLGSNSTIHASPTVAHGSVYLGVSKIDPLYGFHTNTFYALNASTGSKRWSFETGDDVDVPPVMDNGIVYVASLVRLYALDAATGQQKWSQVADGKIYDPLAVSDGMVYIDDGFAGLGMSTLDAFDALTGGKRWSHQATAGTSPFPATETDLGAPFAATGSDWSPPIVVNGVVYVASNVNFINANLSAFDAISGRQKWSHAVDGPAPDPLTVANGTLYMSSLNGGLSAFDPASGNEKWSFGAAADIQPPPVGVNSLVYLGVSDGTVYAINS